MKKIFIISLLSLISFAKMFSQYTFGTNHPQKNSIATIQTIDSLKGIKIPVVKSTDLISPVDSSMTAILVYDIKDSCFKMNNGRYWDCISQDTNRLWVASHPPRHIISKNSLLNGFPDTVVITDNGQIGIGVSIISSDALLKIQAPDSTKGMVLPAVNNTTRPSAIGNKGMLLYNVTDNCYQVSNGTIWECIATGNVGGGFELGYNGLTKVNSDSVKLGGTLIENTVINGLSTTNKLQIQGTGVDAFNIDGNTFSIDMTNNRVGIGQSSPATSLQIGSPVPHSTTSFLASPLSRLRETNLLIISDSIETSTNLDPLPILMLGRPNNFGAWPSQAIFELGKSSQNIGNSNTKLDLKVSRAGYSNDGEDMPTLMTWTADYFGRVGIKIDNPDAVLDVNGVTRVRDNIITGTSNNYIAGGGYAAIIGGFRDTILGGSGSSMIGTVNSDIESGVAYSVIVGGSGNRIATGGHNGAIIAGISNILSHTNSVVMGSNASSTSAYQFTAKFSGGYRLFSNVAGTAGVTLASGGGAWVAVSDKNKKENFFQIDKKEILNKVANLNVENWNYKSQSDSIRHIGPYAQDFFQAFGLGSDSLGIETTDISGVNMAAIQGLYEYIQELELNVSNLKTENSTLKSELNNSKLRDEELKSEIEVIKLMLQRVEK